MVSFEQRIRTAAESGAAIVAREIESEGGALDQRLCADLVSRFAASAGGRLFHRCIVEAVEWAGFVDDPDWVTDGLRYLDSQAPFIKQKYGAGYRGRANPIAALESWDKVLRDPNVPLPPDRGEMAKQLVRFFNDTFAALKQLEWRHDRSWLGPWTFYGAFKIFILHESALWDDPAIDTIRLPMGGTSRGYSFERGWNVLESLGVVPKLPSGSTFHDGIVRTEQAHTEVLRLASLADSRAIHVNSGIYCLGSP